MEMQINLLFIVLSLNIPDELPPRVVIGDGGDVVWGLIGVIHEKGKKWEIIIREREGRREDCNWTFVSEKIY